MKNLMQRRSLLVFLVLFLRYDFLVQYFHFPVFLYFKHLTLYFLLKVESYVENIEIFDVILLFYMIMIVMREPSYWTIGKLNGDWLSQSLILYAAIPKNSLRSTYFFNFSGLDFLFI